MSIERELLQEYINARKAYDQASALKTAANERLQTAEEKLTSYMIDAEKKSTAKFEDLGYASLTAPDVQFPSYDKDREDECFDFIRQIGEGPIIKEAVHPASFKAFVKRLIESATPVPDYITYYLRPKIRLYAKK